MFLVSENGRTFIRKYGTSAYVPFEWYEWDGYESEEEAFASTPENADFLRLAVAAGKKGLRVILHAGAGTYVPAPEFNGRFRGPETQEERAERLAFGRHFKYSVRDIARSGDILAYCVGESDAKAFVTSYVEPPPPASMRRSCSYLAF